MVMVPLAVGVSDKTQKRIVRDRTRTGGGDVMRITKLKREL